MIPTNSAVTAPLDQQESYCGAYLNQLNGNMVGGLVYGKHLVNICCQDKLHWHGL